jgi:hypothetical protein
MRGVGESGRRGGGQNAARREGDGMSQREHDELVAEFMRDKLWQFISIDEWIEAEVRSREARSRIARGVEGTNTK